MSSTLVICAEYYRTGSQTGDADDYMVDGMKLFTLGCIPPVQADSDDPVALREQLAQGVSNLLKEFLAAFDVKEAQFDLQRSFPNYSRLRRGGQGYWIHVTSPQHLSSLPAEFNSRGFTDDQLLGISEEESSSNIETFSMYFNSVGDPIEGPPDKFMLSIGAV